MATRAMPVLEKKLEATKKPVVASAGDIEQSRINSLINKRLPERLGFRRIIHPLWGNHYRINFHDTNDSNIIRDSYHVVVTTDEAIVECS